MDEIENKVTSQSRTSEQNIQSENKSNIFSSVLLMVNRLKIRSKKVRWDLKKMLASIPVGSQGMCMKNLVGIGSVVWAPTYVLTVCTKKRLEIRSKKVRWDSKKMLASTPVGSQGM